MSRRIIEKKKIAIEKLDFSVNNFLNKTTLLLGMSETGKSKIIIDILHILKEEVPVCYIFCPTNNLTRSFTGIVPESCISTVLEIKHLQGIMKMQEERIKIHKLCNDKETLSNIAYKLDESILSKIYVINQNYAKCRKKLEAANKIEKISELDNTYDTRIVSCLKSHIKQYYNENTQKLLSEHEDNIVKFLDINIKVIIVLDDCAANAKEWGKSEIIKEIFFQGRHYQITTIISLQGDKELTPVIRQNAFIVFFTTMQCLKGFFTSNSNNFSKEQQKEAEKIGREIFKKEDNKDTFRKACYIRLKDKLCYHKATIHNKFVFNKVLFDIFEESGNNSSSNSIKLTNDFIKKL